MARLPRQRPPALMYAARGHIQKVTGQELDSNYFTQTLLPELRDGDRRQLGRRSYDARGHFNEPHAGHGFGSARWSAAALSRRISASRQSPGAGIPAEPGLTSLAERKLRCRAVYRRKVYSRSLRPRGLPTGSILPSCRPRERASSPRRALADECTTSTIFRCSLLHDFDKSGFAIRGRFTRYAALRVSEQHHHHRPRSRL